MSPLARAAALPPMAPAHTRKDLMREPYRIGALKAALAGLINPPTGMEHIMRRSAMDLLADIEAADGMATDQFEVA